MGFGGVLWVLSFAEERKYHAPNKTESKKKRIATPVCGLVRNDRARGAAGYGGLSGTPAPTHRLPKESRRGRRPRRPETVDAGFIPVPPHERAAEIGAEAMRKHSLVCDVRLRKVKFPDDFTPICAKESKTIGFGGVLWVLSFAEERKYHAPNKTESKRNGLPHQSADWLTMTEFSDSLAVTPAQDTGVTFLLKTHNILL